MKGLLAASDISWCLALSDLAEDIVDDAKLVLEELTPVQPDGAEPAEVGMCIVTCYEVRLMLSLPDVEELEDLHNQLKDYRHRLQDEVRTVQSQPAQLPLSTD